MGFAPAGNPRIAFAVLVEHGGHGGEVAAPIAMEIAHGYFESVAPVDRLAPKVGLPRRRSPLRGSGSASASASASEPDPAGDAASASASAGDGEEIP